MATRKHCPECRRAVLCCAVSCKANAPIDFETKLAWLNDCGTCRGKGKMKAGVGAFLGFAGLPTRAPRGGASYAQKRKWNRIDRHSFVIERFFLGLITETVGKQRVAR